MSELDHHLFPPHLRARAAGGIGAVSQITGLAYEDQAQHIGYGDARVLGVADMSPKQEAFVREYLVDLNATQAAIRAGYSKKTAGSIGEENLRKPEIRSAVDAALAVVAKRVGVTAERVLRERARIAFFDPRKLLDAEGNPRALRDLDDDSAAAIAALEIVQLSSSEGAPGVISLVKKYRFASKDASLVALEKHLGLTEKPVHCHLPPITSIEDCTKAQKVVLEAVGSGRLGIVEAKALADLIEGQRRTIETGALLARIDAIEMAVRERLPGGKT
ncbi:MAG TPA: terminase small subunit [Hydrogenophaga sp.]|uniref:terminase small subunit n=1 Tax=Hydrogenophaga sp. TaxID=1904254 RepID=UPI002C37521A|nr:terminase small subunit [Hydrogenophaga sp.]HMN92222.1 terminase small subunit [Hydrogenophaga sp.]HMP11574.1 terminase small subunit [Hydrogenophaga sp.]